MKRSFYDEKTMHTEEKINKTFVFTRYYSESSPKNNITEINSWLIEELKNKSYDENEFQEKDEENNINICYVVMKN